VLLWIGLGTRLAAFVLLFLTFVATAAVHWPTMWMMWSDLAKGYAITDMGHGNFKLPLLFAVMLLPLIFGGGGRLSLDRLLSRIAHLGAPAPRHGFATAAVGAAVFAIPFLMLIPALGFALAIVAVVLALLARRSSDASGPVVPRFHQETIAGNG
jgi:putative oxidoreductase